MTPERWRQIEKLCYEALELDSEQRAAFLHSLRAGDEDLWREVESMLAAHDRAGDFLQQNAFEIEAEALVKEKALEKTRLLPVESFSHYRILSRIGVGGMGEVWLALDTKLDRNVALKFLPVQFTSDKDRLQRFVREAKSASALNHPNIITIHEIGESETDEGKIHFIATEFIEGQTLRQVLANEELSLKKALDIASQAAAALDAAHHAGIIHRDIKPENIMLRPDGLVKVLDFGLAKLDARRSLPEDSVDTSAQTQPGVVKTQPGMILGTLRYMSPEQARGREVDARTDIFSLGAVLYELVSKQPLFAGETTADVIAAIINKEPEPLSDFAPDTPPELERIVHKALAKDARDRYQTARDLQIDLQNLKQESEISLRQSRSGQRAQHGLKSSGARNTASQVSGQLTVPRFTLKQLLLAIPVLILLLGAAWWFVFRRQSQVDAPPISLLKNAEVYTWQSAPGEAYSIGAFSPPDGKWIAYISTQSGSNNIWIKQAASGDAEPSTRDNFTNASPIWSPDGEQIAFFSNRGGQPGIWSKPPFGSTSKLLKSHATSEGIPRLVKWSKSGATIYYEVKQNLFAFDINSGQTKQLTTLNPESVYANSLSISPDEQQVAYVVSANAGSVVQVFSVRDGSSKRIAEVSASASNTVWHPDGERVLFSANVDGISQIFVADLDGNKPVQITSGEQDHRVLDVSGDGTRVLYGSAKEESDIWGVRVANAQEFTVASDISSELWPSVSPDSHTIAYQGVKNLSQGNKILHSSILTRDLEAPTQPNVLVQGGALPKWSPDGTRLAFLRLTNSVLGLWAINAVGGKEIQLTTGEMPSIGYFMLPYLRTEASNYDWSPDSNRIAYISRRGGKRNLWVVSADGSGDTPFTDNSDSNVTILCPLWSSDGKNIAYTSGPVRITQDKSVSYSVWVADAETKNQRVIFQSDSFLRLIGWSSNGQELILATHKSKAGTEKPTEVQLTGVSSRNGQQRLLATLQDTYLRNIHLSADKNMIAFSSHQQEKDNLWVIPVVGGKARKLTDNRDPRLYLSSLTWAPDGRTVYFGKQKRFNQLMMIPNFQ